MKSATVEIGQEKYEEYVASYARGRERPDRIQYDYRHTDGSLFSCVRHTLKECRDARDKWLGGKNG